jgi:hypothetical protein
MDEEARQRALRKSLGYHDRRGDLTLEEYEAYIKKDEEGLDYLYKAVSMRAVVRCAFADVWTSTSSKRPMPSSSSTQTNKRFSTARPRYSRASR